jgi:cytochrome c biogenesis protein CcmG, thiol:disulfide interchange protein DsbE
MKKYLALISAIIFSAQLIWIEQSYNDHSTSLDAIPDFILPSMDIDGITISQDDLKHQEIRVINFFASWCGPCKVEHPLLMDLADDGVDILGVDFQDNTDMAKDFLNTQGNPYLLTASDPGGTLGPSWGITSIPQTYVIDEDGQVLFHKSGRLNAEDVANRIQPLLASMKE